MTVVVVLDFFSLNYSCPDGPDHHPPILLQEFQPAYLLYVTAWYNKQSTGASIIINIHNDCTNSPLNQDLTTSIDLFISDPNRTINTNYAGSKVSDTNNGPNTVPPVAFFLSVGSFPVACNCLLQRCLSAQHVELTVLTANYVSDFLKRLTGHRPHTVPVM